jgi:hypothetical protein
LQGRLRANNRRGGGGRKARNTRERERDLSITITQHQRSTRKHVQPGMALKGKEGYRLAAFGCDMLTYSVTGNTLADNAVTKICAARDVATYGMGCIGTKHTGELLPSMHSTDARLDLSGACQVVVVVEEEAKQYYYYF